MTAVRAVAVTGKVGQMCTADIAGAVTVVEVARDLTVAAGDGLLVVKAGITWYAIARTGVGVPPAPEPDEQPDPPPSVPQRGRLVVPAVETRSYRDGKWRTDTDDVYQGQYGGNGNHTGCAFYGSRARSLDGATVSRAQLRIRRPDRGGANAAQALTLRLVTQSRRPSGAVTLGASTAGPSLRRGQTDSSFTIPDAWGQEIVNGTAGGMAVFDGSGSPYVILSGRSDWSAAFTLTIDWER